MLYLVAAKMVFSFQLLVGIRTVQVPDVEQVGSAREEVYQQRSSIERLREGNRAV